MKNLREIWNLFLDILFPPICLNCRKFLEAEEKKDFFLVCKSCFESIPVNKAVFRKEKYLLFGAAPYENEALKNIIRHFKYQGFERLGDPLSRIIIEYLKATELSVGGVAIIPIPLHPSRLRNRGFNQAEVLSSNIGRFLNLPIESRILRRIKNTKSQTEFKNHNERKENVKGCFEMMEGAIDKVKNRSFLLVDDVYTSGGTMDEAAKILRQHGVKDIKALVLAYAG